MKELKNFSFKVIINLILLSFTLYSTLLIFITNKPAIADLIKWKEVTASQYGRQWWQEGSIKKNTDGTIRVLSKFQPSKANFDQSIVYTMDINCEDKLYKDISINENKLNNSIWKSPGGDVLIEGIINETCGIGIS